MRSRGCHLLGSVFATLSLLASFSRGIAEQASSSGPPADIFAARFLRVEDGLPQNSVLAINQTRDGYLWVGTGGGLARFDGGQFKTFGLEDGLPSLQVRALYEDRQGTLWIGTANGIARYDGQRFHSYSTEKSPQGTISELVEDRDGTLWIGAISGLTRWRNGVFDVPDPKIHSGRALAADGNGAIWVRADSGQLLRWREGGFQATGAPADTQTRANRLGRDALGRFWILADGRMFRLSDSKWETYGSQQGLPNSPLLCLGAGADGSIWVGSEDKGLYLLEPGSARFHRVFEEDSNFDAARAIFEDRERNVWVGLRSGGLAKVRRGRPASYFIEQDGTRAMPFSMAEMPDGSLVVSTVGRGLHRIKQGDVAPFLRKELDRYGLRTGPVFCGKDGTLWFVGGGRLLHWKDGVLNDLVIGGGVSSMCEDHDGTLWIGTSKGTLLPLRAGQPGKKITGLPNAPLTTQIPDGTGGMWVAVYGHGVLHLKGNEREWLTKKDGLRSDLVRALYADASGVLWIGTEGGGLNRYQAGQITSFGTREGLHTGTILQILEDNFGFLWLGSYNGILRVPRCELEAVAEGKVPLLHPLVLGRAEGLSSEQCLSSFAGAIKRKDGRLCFGTGNEVVMLDPERHLGKRLPPPVRVEEVIADGQPFTLPQAWLAAEEQRAGNAPEVMIGPGARRLQIHYTSTFFSAPERLRFRYRLTGLDNDWSEATTARSVEYSYLAPGRYRFEVSAHSGTGVWAEPLRLEVVLRPFFWQTPWFKAACAIGLVAVAVVFARAIERRRARAEMRRMELERAMERERSRIARDIHDDLGSRLTKISMITDQARREATAETRFAGHFEHIAATAHDMIERLDETVWVVNPRNDQLDRLCEYLLNYAQDFFQHTPIRCRFSVQEDIPPLQISAEARHHIFLSAKETLNNVARHSGASEVRVELNFAANRLVLTIRDNGKGFDVAQCLALGRGLENLRSRVQSLGGVMNIDSRPGQGATVRLEYDFSAPVGNPSISI